MRDLLWKSFLLRSWDEPVDRFAGIASIDGGEKGLSQPGLNEVIGNGSQDCERPDDDVSATAPTVVEDSSPNEASDEDGTIVPSSPARITIGMDEQKEQQKERDVVIVDWDDGDAHRNPQNWSKASRWFYTGLVCHLAFNVTFASTSPSATQQAIASEFGVGREVGTLIISLFLTGYISGPLIWSPMSEHIGRRIPLLLSFFVNMQLILGQALGQNIQTVLITRFFSGIFAAAPLTLSAGIISDLWDPFHKSIALSLFTASVLSGPGLGPMMGGLVTQTIGWRYTFWILYGYDWLSWIVVFVFLPETYSPVLLTAKARKLRRHFGGEMLKSLRSAREVEDSRKRAEAGERGWISSFLKETILRPWYILVKEPIMWLVTAYQSLIFGLMYGLLELFPVIWQEGHGFTLGQVGLVFLFLFVGTTSGALCNIFINVALQKSYDKGSRQPVHEDRIRGTMLAAPTLVVGIFWLGWAGGYPVSVPWYVPALAAIPIGFGFSLIFITTNTYVVQVYGPYAASALAAATMTRSMFAVAFPLFMRQAAHGIGVQYIGTLFGCIAACLSPIPFVFARYGRLIRARSTFKTS